MKKVVIIAIVFLCASIKVSAQDANIDVKEKRQFENGTILTSPVGTFRGHNFDVCTNPYDPYLLGIYYNENPEWDPKNPSKTYKIPIITKGITYVKVNNANGLIVTGDPVTSSTTPGVAMKATESGMILGVALEDADSAGELLKIRVMIQYLK